jgi:hypothetical protein
MLGLRRFRSLVRGVSNIASRVYPTCAYLMPISGKPEIGGRPILRDGRYATIAFLGKHTYLRPPQDEADKRPAPISIHFQREPL